MYLEKLVNSAKLTKTILCLCVDPAPEDIPLVGLLEHRVMEYYQRIFMAMEKIQCYPAALKFNEAYFLALDEPYTTRHGGNALTELMLFARNHPVLSMIPIIIDCKRSEIGKSAARYAIYYFEKWNCDAITVEPYLGEEGNDPFFAYCAKGKGVYIHARSTTKTKIQNLKVENGLRLSEWVCEETAMKNTSISNLGVVLTGREDMEIIAHLPYISPTTPLLIPGIGAQGGDPQKVAAIISKTQYPFYHRIAVGSSLAYAWKEKKDPKHFAEHAIAEMQRINTIIRGELHGKL